MNFLAEFKLFAFEFVVLADFLDGLDGWYFDVYFAFLRLELLYLGLSLPG